MTLDLVSIVPWEIITQLINLLLLFLLLKHFLFKPVQNVLNARQAEIDKTYAEADAAQTRAEELRDEYEKRIADAKDSVHIDTVYSHKNSKIGRIMKILSCTNPHYHYFQ